MNDIYYDPTELTKAIQNLHPKNELFEVRLIKGKDNYSGYFKSTETLIQALKKINLNGFSVFITLNTIKNECYARKQKDHFVRYASTTSDKNISSYKWLLIDLDPVRVADVSSSAEELNQAENLSNKIIEYLYSTGFCDPLVALSGNGVHILYRIDLINTPENASLIKNVLYSLNQLFSSDSVEVDTTNYNPSRICKLYGTRAQKGADTDERPHRMAQIVQEVSDPETITPRECLEKIADLFTKEDQWCDNSAQINSEGYASSEEWLDKWMNDFSVGYRKDSSSADYIKYYLDNGCPFDSSHNGTSSIVFIRKNDGQICYKCQHDSCANKTWKDFRMFYDPEAYNGKKKDDLIERGWKKHINSVKIKEEYASDPRSEFHIFNGSGIPTKTKDQFIVDDILTNDLPIVIYQKIPYVYNHGYYKRDEDGNRVKSMIKDRMFPELITAQRIKGIYDLLLTSVDNIRNEEDLNQFPDHWINFKNGFLNVKTLELINHDPKYFAMNQIPSVWDPDIQVEASTTKKFLEGLIPSEEDRKMFLEFSGLCMTKDMHFQKMLYLKGSGGIGKSVLLKMIQNALGRENYISVDPHDFEDNRFASYSLVMRLANILPDITTKSMKNIAVLKNITGQDETPAEIKNGKRFNFHPYCKMIFSCNSIPKAMDDQTNAYYRRLLILPINKRSEYIPNLDQKLKDETGVFIKMIVEALHIAYTRTPEGKLTESKSSTEEVNNLYEDTDPVQAFISEILIITNNDLDRITTSDLYDEFKKFCEDEGREKYILTKRNFFRSMEDKGFIRKKSNGSNYFSGISMKADPEEVANIFDHR